MNDLISRQAAMDALGEEPLVWHEDDAGEVAERNQWRRDVAAIKALPSAQPGWIPCSERQPDEEGKYLVTSTSEGKSYIDVDEYVKHYHGGTWLFHFGVTAWMLLPEPYQEVAGGKSS